MVATAKRSVVLLAACCVIALAAASAAQAAPTWLSPVKLSPAGAIGQRPQVAVNAGGDSVAAWEFVPMKGAIEIEAAGRPAGAAAWQTPVTISKAAEGAFFPQVAIDSAGDAVAVWMGKEKSEYQIEASTRKGLSGSWSTPVALSTPGVNPSREPDLAMNAQGDAVAVWEREKATEKFVEARYMTHGSGTWGPIQELTNSAEEGESSAQVGIDAAGNATAVWEGFVTPNVDIVESTRPASSGVWQAPKPISLGIPNANIPKLVVGPEGNAAAVWEQFEGSENIEVATRASATSAWGAPVRLSVPGKEPGEQTIALGGHGVALALWQRDGVEKSIEGALGSTASGTWGTAQILSGEPAEEPAGAVNGEGDAIVTWTQYIAGVATIEAASRPFGSAAWGAPFAFPSAGLPAHEPDIAADSRADATAVWQHYDGTNYRVEAAGLDGSGPQLAGLTIPASGVVGQALSFSVSPLDVWSALGATTWSFGDGTTQVGSAVTHAYTTTGPHTVTVTSADVLGNATSSSATVTITAATTAKPPVAAPPPPPPPVISGARLSHNRFRVARRPTAISAKRAPLGTNFLFTLSEPSSLTITITHSLPGLRSGRRCLAPSARLRSRHAKRCRRTVTVGTLTRAKERKGRNSVYFSGRLGARALAPGAYTAVLRAFSGGRGSLPVALTLTIVR